MKRKFLIIFIFGIFSISIQAQNFNGGFLLGLSTSQVGGDNLGGFYKAGLLIGIFANNSISKLINFQMEMNYIQKGSNNSEMNNEKNRNYLKEDISLSYVEIPLLLKYHQNNKLQIEWGIVTAYLIDGHYNDVYGEIPKYKNEDPFINYDLGLLAGINYKYSKNISLNTRISNSILPIGNEDYGNNASYNYYRKGKYNTVLSFTLYYNL